MNQPANRATVKASDSFWQQRRLTRWVLGLTLLAIVLISITVYATETSADDFRAAGCYLPLADGIVVGINRTTNTVQLPMGRRDGSETAQATAARETMEETGIAVDVGVKLLSVSDSSVHIFLCRPVQPVPPYDELRALDRLEVKEVLVVDPNTLRNYDGRIIDHKWRYDETRLMIKWLDKLVPRTVTNN